MHGWTDKKLDYVASSHVVVLIYA